MKEELSMETFIVGCIDPEFLLCDLCWWKDYCRSEEKVVGAKPFVFRVYNTDIKPESLRSVLELVDDAAEERLP